MHVISERRLTSSWARMKKRSKLQNRGRACSPVNLILIVALTALLCLLFFYVRIITSGNLFSTESAEGSSRYTEKLISPQSTSRLYHFSWEWLADPGAIMKHAELQRAFHASHDKKAFRPQPYVYRPKLPGMGWGNLLYDISHNLALAMILQRPFLMSFDLKDKFGVVEDLLQPAIVDWRFEILTPFEQRIYSLDDFESVKTSDFHVHVTCRPSDSWFKLCGGNQGQGSLDEVIPKLLDMPQKVVYSSYSASVIMPLRNSRAFRSWIDREIAKSVGGWDTLSLSVRFAFPYLFRPSPDLEAAVASILTDLGGEGAQYDAVHIRTGNLEDHKKRDDRGLKTLADDFEECRQEIGGEKWLFLSDNLDLVLEIRRRNLAVTTFEDSSFNMGNGMHVGKMNLRRGGGDKAERKDAAKQSWLFALRDFLLMAQSSGSVWLRNTMSSAGSYGERASFIGGKSCHHSATSCANGLFQKVCTARLPG